MQSVLEHFLDFLAMGDGVDAILEHFFALVAIVSAVGRTVVYAVSGRTNSVRWADVPGVFIRTMFIMTVICLVLYFVCAILVIKMLSGLVW